MRVLQRWLASSPSRAPQPEFLGTKERKDVTKCASSLDRNLEQCLQFLPFNKVGKRLPETIAQPKHLDIPLLDVPLQEAAWTI